MPFDVALVRGDTALWDAMNIAADELKEWSKQHPTAKKRILVLSDGMVYSPAASVEGAMCDDSLGICSGHLLESERLCGRAKGAGVLHLC